MRFVALVGAAFAVTLASWSCSGSSGTFSSTSGAPSSTSAVTIAIQFSNGSGNLGSQSFSPNPASVTQGTMVVWNNNDSTTHHILLNDGSLDTGTIAPGTSSAPMVLTVRSAQYHCTIHPTMVGSINTPTTSSTPGAQ